MHVLCEEPPDDGRGKVNLRNVELNVVRLIFRDAEDINSSDIRDKQARRLELHSK